MAVKNYQYYILGAFTFVAWVLLVFFALETAVYFTA
jgi:hypothetical protein